MSSETALLGQPFWARARVARGQGLRRTGVALLLLACACGGSDASPGTPPAPSGPPSAGPVAPAPASPPADSISPAPDAGTVEPAVGEPVPSDTLPLSPDDSANDPAASSDAPEEIDIELACSSGQSQVICLDTESIVICLSGIPIQSRCSVLCDSYGRETGPCDDGCQCGEPTSPTCARASEDYCACSALVGSEPCTPATVDRLYLACYVNGIGGELMACTVDFRATRPDAPIDATFCADLDDACD